MRGRLGVDDRAGQFDLGLPGERGVAVLGDHLRDVAGQAGRVLAAQDVGEQLGVPGERAAGSSHTSSNGYHSNEKKSKSSIGRGHAGRSRTGPVHDRTPFASGQANQSGSVVW